MYRFFESTANQPCDGSRSQIRGFTLIEILIVLAILGILIGIAIPIYSFYLVRSRVTEMFNLASYAKVAITEYRIVKGVMPSSNAQLALTNTSSQFVKNITIGPNGTITIAGNQTNLGTGASLSIVLTPTFNNGVVSWSCNASGATNYVPSTCQ